MIKNSDDDTQKLSLHKSVLVTEVVTYLNPQPNKVYLDVTFGTGGHTKEILKSEPNCKVIAMDWDHVALDTYGLPLQEEFGDRLRLVWGNFSLLYKILKKENIHTIDGILADFGTSQIQIHQRAGFSIYKDTPLDMRMSPPHQTVTAEQVIAKSTEEKLREILWQLGEEPRAKQIARAIVEARARSKHRIRTTGELAKIVESAFPGRTRKGIHPATRVFQALRIYVNHELQNISAFLPAGIQVLNTGGRFLCISFHSLEDRIVKNYFKEQESKGSIEILTVRPVVPGTDEIRANPSSRSAKLRVAQKI